MLFGNINKGIEEYRATPDAILVDVRELDEFAYGHIAGAVNIPLPKIAEIACSKDTAIFLYCLRGSRSMKAARILKKKGFMRVRSIGGIKGYKGLVER